MPVPQSTTLGQSKLNLTFDCGHSRLTRYEYPVNDDASWWVGTEALCDQCNKLITVMSVTSEAK